MQTYKVACPHCGEKARIAKSVQITPLYKEFTCSCTNAQCGHVWVASMSPVRTLSPSATPDPAVAIPLSPHIRREAVRAQMEDTR